MDTKLWEFVDRYFRKSDISGAIESLESLLTTEQGYRFKGLLGASFSNSPSSILSATNTFIDACSKKFDLKAVYFEMNGFDINPDRWYFDSWAYDEYGSDPQDIEWLCNVQSLDWPQVTLQGLEGVQADFEWYHSNEIWKDKTFEKAYDLATLLVMCKYVALIQSGLESGTRSKAIPVLATAHDFDILGRFET